MFWVQQASKGLASVILFSYLTSVGRGNLHNAKTKIYTEHDSVRV